MIEPGSVARSDQRRALWLTTFAFTLCFAVWTVFSIFGIQLKQKLGLTDTERGLLMATPILTGSISRLFLGLLTDRFGDRWVFGLLILFTAAAVFLISIANSYPMLLLAALGIGLAGGGFIVGVTYKPGTKKNNKARHWAFLVPVTWAPPLQTLAHRFNCWHWVGKLQHKYML